MTDIKAWVISVCFAALAAGLYKTLLPGTANKRVMEMLLGVFILSVVILPVTNGFNIDIKMPSLDMSAPSPGLIKMDEAVREQVKKSTEEALKLQIKEVLEKEKINDAEIRIIMDTEADKRISISRADIYIKQKDADKSYLIKERIKNFYGIDSEIYILEG